MVPAYKRLQGKKVSCLSEKKSKLFNFNQIVFNVRLELKFLHVVYIMFCNHHCQFVIEIITFCEIRSKLSFASLLCYSFGISPHSTGHRPLLGPLPKKPQCSLLVPQKAQRSISSYNVSNEKYFQGPSNGLILFDVSMLLGLAILQNIYIFFFLIMSHW